MAVRVPHDRLPNGTARAVAMGVDPSTAIVSERELEQWARLAYASENAMHAKEELAEKNAAKKALCAEHAGRWGDTLDTRIQQKLSARDRAQEEAERRRRIIDEEEAAYQAAELQKKRQVAVAKLQARDQRTLEMNSQLALQATLDERAVQLRVQAEIKARRAEHDREVDDAVAAMAKASELRQKARAEAAKEAVRTVKTQYLVSIEEHRNTLRLEKIAKEEEGRRIREENEAIRKRQLEDLAARKEAQFHSLKEWTMGPETLTPRSTYEKRRAEADVVLAAEPLAPSDARFFAMKAHQQQSMNRLARDQFVSRQLTIANMAERLAATTTMSPRERCADVMSSARSMESAMIDNDSARVRKQKDLKGELRASLDSDVARHSARKEAFVSQNVRHSENLAVRIAELEAFDAEERRLQRDANERAKRIQILQAKEKKAQVEYDRAMDLEEGRAMVRGLGEYEASMDEYLRQEMAARHPGEWNPTLMAKALSPRRDLRLPA